MSLLVYVVLLVVIAAMLWPGSPAGQAVKSVTGAVSGMLR